MQTIRQKIPAEIQDFLDAFIELALKKYNDQILSIILFGSAVTNEWIKGKSDVDIIVVIKDATNKNVIENVLNKIVLDLDSRYKLGLRGSCSTYRTSKNPIMSLFNKIEDFLAFGRPVNVLSRDLIDFREKKIKDLRIKIITTIFTSLTIYLLKLKQSGMTIFGEDLIQELELPIVTRMEKMRTAIAPIWLLIASFITVIFDHVLSLKHAVKATKWASEDVLVAIDEPLSTTYQEFTRVEYLFRGCKGLDFNHLDVTMDFLVNWLELKHTVTLKVVTKYLFDATLFIITLYAYTILRGYQKGGVVSDK
jgi:predicted nucleotidyltransferase